jgi:hypothetical protein
LVLIAASRGFHKGNHVHSDGALPAPPKPIMAVIEGAATA